MQDGTEAKAAGKNDEQVELIRGFSRRFYNIVLQSKDASEIERETKALYGTLTDAEKKALDWPNLGGTLSLSWALRPESPKALRFDVRPFLRKVRCPVLALNGGKDSQVPPKENLGGIERELKAGGNSDYTLRELPGLNHLLQTCSTGAFSEYVKIEETMSPLVLQTISDWIIAETSAVEGNAQYFWKHRSHTDAESPDGWVSIPLFLLGPSGSVGRCCADAGRRGVCAACGDTVDCAAETL
jgi:hypothetical protein